MGPYLFIHLLLPLLTGNPIWDPQKNRFNLPYGRYSNCSTWH